METIIAKYRGKTTPKGHELRVDESTNQIIIWYLHWGDYKGTDAHHHMGIAIVRFDTQGYSVGTLNGTETSPRSWQTCNNPDDVITQIDKVVAER